MKHRTYKLNEICTLYLGYGDPETVEAIERVICKKISDTSYEDILTENTYQYNNFTHSQKGKPVVFDEMTIMQSIKDPILEELLLSLDTIDTHIAELIYYHLNDIELKPKPPTNCTILSNKEINYEPSKYRYEELEKLLISIALNKKPILITGPSGIGKTSLVEQLVYLKKQNKIPEFLENTEILEINLASLNNPKEELQTILSYIKENKAILYISGINHLDLSNDSILKMLINESERQKAKIIISSNDPNFKKHLNIFETIEINKLTEEQIKEIIIYKTKELSEKNNILIKEIEHNLEEITSIIYECTQEEPNVIINNNISNPGFSISIIEKAFAIAKTKNLKQLEINNIIKAIETTENIYPNKKKSATTLLEDLITKQEKPKLIFKK